MNVKRIFYHTAYLVTLATLTIVSLTACGGADTISGKVSWDKTPITDCTIRLESGDGSTSATIAEVQTDSSGKYKIEGVVPGNYLLTINFKIDGVICSGLTTVIIPEGKGVKSDIELAGWANFDMSSSVFSWNVIKLTRDGWDYGVADYRTIFPDSQPLG